MIYHIRRASTPPPLIADWHHPAWSGADEISITHFRPESSSHHPQTFARILHDATGLHGIFLAHDRYVRCQRVNYYDSVWKDSCVEFFVQPRGAGGYFNFEFNCGGAFLCNYITDSARHPERLFQAFEKVSPDLAPEIKVKASLPALVDPELTEPTDWTLQFFIPFKLLEVFTGPLGDARGQTWHGNFFKCAEEVSHPHWASWSPVDEFNFHLPRCFGELKFAD